MKVDKLSPAPDQKTQFAWSHHVTVPETAGCYAIATFNGEILYVGLASRSIRDRMGKHLDTDTKRAGAAVGAPFWFYYLVRTNEPVAPIERGWMNQAILHDGDLPPLNKVHSPI